MSNRKASQRKTTTTTTTTTTNPPTTRRSRRARNNRRRFSRRQMRTAPQPYAYGISLNSEARLNQRGTSASLSTREIFQVKPQANGLSYMLPMCPTKWSGTRTAQLAATYSAHRPLALRISWYPSVATSTSGSVAIGTMFDGARFTGADSSWSYLSRQLASSNGGFITTLWKSCSSTVNTGRNLRANTFPLYEVQDDDIPFWILVAANCDVSDFIGYLVVETLFTLRNPISCAQALPSSGAGIATFTHKEATSTAAASTIMTMEAADVHATLTPGTSYSFVAAQPLLDTAGKVIYSVCQEFIAQYIGLDTSGKPQFSVSNYIKSLTSLAVMVGISSFFRSNPALKST